MYDVKINYNINRSQMINFSAISQLNWLKADGSSFKILENASEKNHHSSRIFRKIHRYLVSYWIQGSKIENYALWYFKLKKGDNLAKKGSQAQKCNQNIQHEMAYWKGFYKLQGIFTISAVCKYIFCVTAKPIDRFL